MHAADEGLAALAAQFQDTGQVAMADPSGRRLFIINVASLLGKPAVLLAHEGNGSMVFDFDRPLNAFRLISVGFPIEVAEQAANLLALLFPATKRLTTPAKARLKGPKL